LLRALTVGLVAVLWPFCRRAPKQRWTGLVWTNWVAEASTRIFQALADGTYKNYGLDSLSCRAAQRHNRILLIAGARLLHGANTLMSFDAVTNNVRW